MAFLLSFTRRTSSRALQCRRTLATARPTPSEIYLDPSKSRDPAVATTPDNITADQRDALDSALRVDLAGEVAANWIYKGQLSVLGKDPTAGPLIQVRTSKNTGIDVNINVLLANVGSGEEAFGRYE
jgi:hypothetical protein